MESRRISLYGRQLTVCDDGTIYYENGRKASVHETQKGYLCISLQGHSVRVHRLVAMAFLENLEGKSQVDHKDGNPKNNCLDNLEWVTPKENIRRAAARLSYSGERNSQSRLKEYEVIAMKKQFFEEGVSKKELAQQYGISEGHVGAIMKKKKWSHLM